MKIFTLFFLLVAIISCDIQEKEKNNASTSSINNSKDSSYHLNLKGQVYTSGKSNNLNENCQFYFACDCCSGNILFHTDSTFYALNYCTGDTTICNGFYRIDQNILYLNYSGFCLNKIYNWDSEFDTLLPSFYYKDTIFEPTQQTYSMDTCLNQMIFTNQSESITKSNLDFKPFYNLKLISDFDSIFQEK